ncbi:MAG: diguanylate cyclase [Holosporaceae bacterium]|jgi:diguanylate cyclase (GGDEF)-like protein|nr:diguanylate cyclase [Holosporaceae bacterium]
MVARVLVVNESKADLSKISSELKKHYFALLFSKSVEDSLRIINSQSIDIVMVSVPPKISNIFQDFFSILRQQCSVTPIVGILDSKNGKDADIPHFFCAAMDDFIYTDVKGSTLVDRMNALVKIKDRFDESLLNRMHIGETGERKIVSIFHDNVDFLHESVLKNTELVMLNTWPVIDNLHNADLFLISMTHEQANECCAGIRLRKANRYKPIVFTFYKDVQEKAKRSMRLNFGCSDIINLNSNRMIIASRINSLIKYKRLHEVFSMKIKKSLYLSAVDSTTEVYSRSFFEDYLKMNTNSFVGSAILMIDIDKFKFINDKFGHSFADSMLKYISNNIKRYVRSSDVIARYGGDEFIIIMGKVDKLTAIDIAHRIQKKIESSYFHEVQCTVSVGVCCLESGEKMSIQDAISVADKFMYIAKQSGGNSVKICA